MKTTPCQKDPEKWVGDDKVLRAQAARECMDCPALDWCLKQPAPEFGVQAAIDYTTPRASTPRKGTAGRSKVCAWCQGVFEMNGKESISQWVARKTCGRSCGSRAGHARKAA